MLTKEFAQRVELSEKQVRKIVQHLEERGYQLNKTEYRGREATDFQEEDIELFQDIAEKVKQTNSYDLAFEELEKEKDFLQVLVKDVDAHLPSNSTADVHALVEELRYEISKMREERHMLGQMMNQVNQQQQELRELQSQINDKIDKNAKSLQNIESTQQEQLKATQSVAEKQANAEATAKQDVEKSVDTENVETTKKTSSEKDSFTESTTEHATAPKTTTETASTKTDASTEASNETDETPKSSATETEKTETATAETKQDTLSEVETTETTEAATAPSTTENDAMSTQQQPEEKKGFFKRLFNL